MISAQGSGKGGSMKILVQYEGFSVSTTSRTYNFHVIDAPGESRQFTVNVPLQSFRLTPLKFQDGPLITYERVKEELDRETQESHAAGDLNIGEPDIQGYLARHYPPKARKNNFHPRSASSRPNHLL